MATPLHETHPHLPQQALLFASVFSLPSLVHTTPTPIATPRIGTGGFADGHGANQSFTSGTTSAASSQTLGRDDGDAENERASRLVKRNAAWSVATRFLGLRDGWSDGGRLELGREGVRDKVKTREVSEALQYLLVGYGRPDGIREGVEGSLIEWYLNDVRTHFMTYAEPSITKIWANPIEKSKAWSALQETIAMLNQAQRLYLQPVAEHILPILKAGDAHAAAIAEEQVPRDVQATFIHALPMQRLSKTLSYVLFDAGCQLFRLQIQASAESTKTAELQKAILDLLHGLRDVGLGNEFAQRAFAHAMDKLMGEFIISHYMKVDWYGRKSITAKLRQWVKEGFAPFVRMVMKTLGETVSADERAPEDVVGGAAEIQQWQDMAIGRLGRARVDNLFDYIVNWDRSLGAILDLKEYITNNADRAYLIVSFIGQLHRRLLRAGTTTTHILDVYIYVIRAFQELEPRGVLLNRVAQPIRHYLRDRPDTAKVIVASLLADTEDEKGNKVDPGGDISVEIAAEMQKPFANANEYDEDLNWNDMNWTPEPQDAGPEYRNSKTDVMSYLLTLYDREEFITELKNILGEHLLKHSDSEFEKERRLLELFKLRLGDDKLQACEVMLKDMEESKRINTLIHNKPQPTPSLPSLTTQILSSFFWPPLRDDTFAIPPPILAAQNHFSSSFESIKDMRKLTYLSALGKASVQLELSDRTVEVECGTWQASVIYAFQPAPNEPNRLGGVMRTVSELEESLEMEESLVRNALMFWVGERVLAPHPSIPDAYTVLEKLSEESENKAAEAAQEAKVQQQQGGEAGVMSSGGLLERNRAMYEQFVIGMLTNQGSMPVPRMLMMLRMVVPGGFPGGEEELTGLLEELKEREMVVLGGGGIWAVKK